MAQLTGQLPACLLEKRSDDGVPEAQLRVMLVWTFQAQQRMMQRSARASNSRWWPARAERTRSSTSARREKHQKRSEICWSVDRHDGTPESVTGLSFLGGSLDGRDSARGWTDQLIRLSRHADETSGALCGPAPVPRPSPLPWTSQVSLHKNRISTLFLHAARVLVLIALHKMTACSVAPRVSTWVLVFHRRNRLEKSLAVMLLQRTSHREEAKGVHRWI